MTRPSAAVVVGASSGLGRALAEHLSACGHDLILCARNLEDLEAIGKHLTILHGTTVIPMRLDLEFLTPEAAQECVDEWLGTGLNLDQFYFTAGMIHANDSGYQSVHCLDQLMSVNFFGIVNLISQVVRRDFQQPVHIAAVSSIAAIRARGVNIAYASSKKALEFYLMGYQHFLDPARFTLQLFRVGYMHSGMSRGKKLLLPIAEPAEIARKIYTLRTLNKRLIYLPGFWRFVAWAIYTLPWRVYKNLNF